MSGNSLVRLIVSLVIGICLTISACAPAAPAPEEVEEKPFLRMAVQAASMGGTGILRANTISAILRRQLNIDATVVLYPSASALDVLHEGLCAISAATYPHLAADAYTNTGVYADKEEPWTEIRALATATISPMQIFVIANSPYRTFRDLLGERICPGKKGVITELLFTAAIEALGIPEEELDLVYVAYEEGGAAMITGKLAAYFALSPPPHPIFTSVDLTQPIRLIGFTEKDRATILEKNTTFAKLEIPAIWYHMEEPALTIGLFSVMTTTSALPEEVAYEVVKFWNENPDFLAYFHISHSEAVKTGQFKWCVENGFLGCPYHIGAYRYFQEIGWHVPAEMIPPEAK